MNNRRNNLRIATTSQNNHNAVVRIDSITGCKGVQWYPRYDKWVARIQVNGQRINLGYFISKEEAKQAYDVAALKYHGEFARTNAMMAQEAA
jgi:hypothetical protein